MKVKFAAIAIGAVLVMSACTGGHSHHSTPQVTIGSHCHTVDTITHQAKRYKVGKSTRTRVVTVHHKHTVCN
jgi:ABC-type Fe3+-hydroxamate transport system substrate-binding protein